MHEFFVLFYRVCGRWGGKGWKRGVEKAILEENSPTKFSKYKEHNGGQTIRQNNHKCLII
jgi:hypothetical protein